MIETHRVHHDAFGRIGLGDAFGRVVAIVVQPGVEFGHSDIVRFRPEAARDLTASLRRMPGLVFEAHSTDYQAGRALRALVAGGFCILKVGPWLTFSLREALYGLDAAADVMDGHVPRGRLMAAMDRVMQDAPAAWRDYYRGDEAGRWVQRHYSYSDRIRYYWPDDGARAAVDALRDRLAGRDVPEPILSQFVPNRSGRGERADFDGVQLAAVLDVLRLYDRAATGEGADDP